jgi:hypothetical protein
MEATAKKKWCALGFGRPRAVARETLSSDDTIGLNGLF